RYAGLCAPGGAAGGYTPTTYVSAAHADTVATVVQTAMATACQSSTQRRGVPPATSSADVNWVGMASGPRMLAPGTPNRTSHRLNRRSPFDSALAGRRDAVRVVTGVAARAVRSTTSRTLTKLPAPAATATTTGWIPPATPISDATSPSRNGTAAASRTTNGWTISGTCVTSPWKLWTSSSTA